METQSNVQQTVINYGTSQGNTNENAPTPPNKPTYEEGDKRKLIFGVVAVVIILAVAGTFFLTSHRTVKPSTTTTTVPPTSMFDIKNCTTLNKPGTYYLLNSIFAKIRNSSCITITANDVKLEGNGNLIHGSGPYAVVPPYSYGIEAKGVSNISISNLGVSDFSYGIYFDGVQNSTVSSVNATNNTMSNIFLFDSYNNIVENSSSMKSSSKNGGILLIGGSGNKLRRVSSDFNIYYGLVINSTNNTIEQSSFENNPGDVLCNASTGMLYANKFFNNSCNTNFYCEFATCKKTNMPINFASQVLAPGRISSCGELVYAGNYTLTTSIDLSKIINISNPLTKSMACITIKGSSINLNCDNHTVSGIGFGIVANNNFNLSITNCRLANLNKGILLANLVYPKVSGIRITNTTTGIELYNVTGGTLSNIQINNTVEGILYNATAGITTKNIKAYNNSYGIYFNAGNADLFSNSNITNNYKADVYCSPSTYNSTSNLFQTSICGVSDCIWANCKSYVLPQLAKYPVSSCMVISHSGNYSLQNNLIANNTCIQIQTNNVLFDCNNHTITGKGIGYGILAENATNVTVENCKLVNFEVGSRIININRFGIQNMLVNSTQVGFYASNVANGTINSDTASIYSLAGFKVEHGKNINIVSDMAVGGLDNASGFIFANVSYSNIAFDSSKRNPTYGFAFISFRNNSVENNTASTNRFLDYYCSPNSAGFFADSTGENIGVTKNTCRWIVVEPLVPVNPPCQAISSPSQISLSTDMVYTYGTTCYNIYNTNSSSANDTVINCNGHTVLATNGGVFVQVRNSSHVTLENCYLKNFTQPVIVKAPYAQILNNTIANSKYAISLDRAIYNTIDKNYIFNSTYAISAYAANYTNIENNHIYSQDGILLNKGSNLQLYNNTAIVPGYAAQFFNSTALQLKDNLFNGTVGGVACYGLAKNVSSASQDFGGNRCSSNLNCTWITSLLCE